MTSFDELVKIATESSDFRQRLLDNAEVAAREAGLFLPGGTGLVVHQNTTNEINVVIGGQTAGLPDEALQLLSKAQQDAAFKSRLISDPALAIQAEIGVVVPPSLKICVHENTSVSCHVVLPPMEPPTGELSDLELEGVAGGKGKRPTTPLPPSVGRISSVMGIRR